MPELGKNDMIKTFKMDGTHSTQLPPLHKGLDSNGDSTKYSGKTSHKGPKGDTD